MITQLSFIKKQENIMKNILLNDIIKKSNIGKITLKVDIIYKDNISDQKNTSDYLIKEYIRSSSATPISKTSPTKCYFNNPKQISSGRKEVKNSNNLISSKIPNNSITKNVYISIDKITQEAEKKTKKNEKDLDSSMINSIFEENNLENIEKLGERINKFIKDFSKKYFDENTEKIVEFKLDDCQDIVEKLFELQELYYEDFNNSNILCQNLKSFLFTYNEYFRMYLKKNNRLNEALESIKIKEEFSHKIYKEEKTRINECLKININEIEIFKKIFKIDYDNSDFLKYKHDVDNKKCNFFYIKNFKMKSKK